jgi:hypothetical protein
MVDDLKHKWVRLDELVVQVLHEMEPGKYEPYILPDGTVIVRIRMNKISYGYVEVAHYWWKSGQLQVMLKRYKSKDDAVLLRSKKAD